MAMRAFDLMIRDMIFVLELRGVLGAQDLGFVMTLDTLSFRYVAVPLDHIEMTLLTGHPSFDVFPMVETPTLDFDVSLRLEVARGATADRTGKTFFLSFRASLVIVTDETVGFVNREVLPLDHLGVTGGASQLHPPFQLVQMFTMGEGDIFVDHISTEILDLVTPFLQAAGIADLRVRRRRLFPRDEIGQRDLSVNPFSFQMIEEAWRIVTLGAGDIAMAGDLP
jgi:hypothetical protein